MESKETEPVAGTSDANAEKKKKRRSNAQRQKDYRTRQKKELTNEEIISNRKKLNAERVRKFREKRKLARGQAESQSSQEELSPNETIDNMQETNPSLETECEELTCCPSLPSMNEDDEWSTMTDSD